MTVAIDQRYQWSLHPLHGILLAGTIPLFLGALFSDIAYASSSEIQWKNFASWLIAGGLLFGGLALLWAFLGLLGIRQRGQRPTIYFSVLLAAWLLGFINALVHAEDAWASMPQGLILSAIVPVLTLAATGFGFVHFARKPEMKRAMSSILLLVALSAVVGACSRDPEPEQYGPGAAFCPP